MTIKTTDSQQITLRLEAAKLAVAPGLPAVLDDAALVARATAIYNFLIDYTPDPVIPA